MLAILGAVVLTGIVLYALWAVASLWWLLFVGAFEANLGSYMFCLFWTIIGGGVGYFWWVAVGSHISVNFS